LRIIGGKYKGKRLNAPANILVRPTTDFAKEGLFNILNNRIDWKESSVLDLFAGIGGLSLEATSRGALTVRVVEINPLACRWLKETAKQMKILNYCVEKSDALHWLRENNLRFDLILADPPYEFAHYKELIELVRSSAMAEEASFVLEHRKSMSFLDTPGFVEERTYGEVRFSFFES
jgi:16S rRNA (guanine966-N2)-methyltransferase